jgi:translation initiation factor 2 subunit 2
MDEYEKLLNTAYEQVKKTDSTGERFEIPKVEGHFEGKKTIISNFAKIAEHLRRPIEHLQKFLLKEIAAAGQIESDRLIINKKISSKEMNPKIEEYVKEFVVCKECNKPDTEIVKEDRMNFIHCLACGAKHPIRTKV